MSEDGRHALAIIAFVGSVFSPYYAWGGRRDPLDHCALNVALYGPRAYRWSMTERPRGNIELARHSFTLGPSRMLWGGSGLDIEVDEWAVPMLRRLRGRVHLEPLISTDTEFALDTAQRHHWRPIAPRARVEVTMTRPSLAWRGIGYLDCNFGDEPLEDAFASWQWSRADCGDRAVVLYHAEPRDGAPLALALACTRAGRWDAVAPMARVELPGTRWGLPRRTLADDGGAHLARALEDGPFYARSLLRTNLLGRPAIATHETLSLDRFATSWVKLLLPFRMPRAIV